MDAAELVAWVRGQLEAHADAEKSAYMRAYLKTEQPMYGASRPAQKPIWSAMKKRFVPADRDEWEAGVRALWAGPEREMQYAAIEFAKGFKRMGRTGRSQRLQAAEGSRSSDFLDPDAVPLVEQLVREGAWWDLVDDIAVNLAGAIVAKHREAMRPVMERWITDEDEWIRRTALLAQLKHKGDADLEQHFDFCRRCAHEKSFWIRKAIGWSLRDHSRRDPDAIRAFLEAHGHELSGLSRREASKYV
ncbi:MAG: DNA alkylation repair protein [Alphaproteobacteria bacterium]|nr:DNA alkylation repair protein [Alphaproteobacteria bacterium]